MAIFFKKKDKKEKTIDDIIENDVAIYLQYIKDINFMSQAFLSADYKKILASNYVGSINCFVQYLEVTFDDGTLSAGNVLTIDENEMLTSVPDCAKELFLPPAIQDLIYINEPNDYAHMHTENGKVVEMESVHTLRGLDPILRNVKINSLFNGMSVDEAYALLNQMGLVNNGNSELERMLFVYKVKKQIRRLFLRDIIYKLLSRETEMSIVRARLFADTYQVDFDFSYYELKLEEQKRLKKDVNKS